MKKVVLLVALAMIGFSLHAQEGLKLGANLGLPVGDAGDVSGFSIGLDLSLIHISEPTRPPLLSRMPSSA